MKAQRGFSMIEFMIAIVLGLIVTDALVSLFVGVRSASRTTSGVAAVADSGRFALDTMAQVLRGAGEMACNATLPLDVQGTVIARQITTLSPGASPLISWVGGPVGVTSGQPLAGYEAVNTAPGQTIAVSASPTADTSADDWTSSVLLLGGNLDAVLLTLPPPAGFAAPVGSLVQGSDILVVNETPQTGAPVYTTADATGGGAFAVNTASGFSPGQLAVISNCGQSELFEVGTFAGSGDTGSIGLPGAPPPGNASNTLAADIQFTIGSHVALVDTIVFYVGVGADGEGALFEYQTNGGVLGSAFCTNQELVPDVENMQILYGVQNLADEIQYVTADAVPTTSYTQDFNGVVSLRIALLVASPPSAVPVAATSLPSSLLGVTWNVPVADSRMRKVYDQTVFLRDMNP